MDPTRKQFLKDLGMQLREAREECRMTQLEVAQRYGYSSAQHISNIERGISPISEELLASLVGLYHMNPKKLIRFLVTKEKQRWETVFGGML